MSADERDASIRELSSQGLPVRAIARELGVSKSTVGRVLVAEQQDRDMQRIAGVHRVADQFPDESLRADNSLLVEWRQLQTHMEFRGYFLVRLQA